MMVQVTENRPASIQANPSPPAAQAAGENSVAGVTTSPQSAVRRIMAGDPQVVAFGEVHKTDKLSYQSTSTHFANEILPLLPQYGITDLVLEAIPDDPRLDAELANFMKTGVITYNSQLGQWLDGPDRCGYLAILEQARKSGITIHGGHLSLAEAPNAFQVGALYDRDPDGVTREIRDHTYNKIKKLVSEGKRVASFGGMRHNNIKPAPQDTDASYGDELRQEIGSRYREVDLLVPSQAAGQERQIDFPLWDRRIPAAGVYLLKKGERFLLIYPRERDIRELPSIRCPK